MKTMSLEDILNDEKDAFIKRHLGFSQQDQDKALEALGLNNIDELIKLSDKLDAKRLHLKIKFGPLNSC